MRQQTLPAGRRGRPISRCLSVREMGFEIGLTEIEAGRYFSSSLRPAFRLSKFKMVLNTMK